MASYYDSEDVKFYLNNFLETKTYTKERERAIKAFLRHGTMMEAARKTKLDRETILKHVALSLLEELFILPLEV